MNRKFTREDLSPYIKLFVLKGMEEGVYFDTPMMGEYLKSVINDLDWLDMRRMGWVAADYYWQFTEKFVEDIIEGKYFAE